MTEIEHEWSFNPEPEAAPINLSNEAFMQGIFGTLEGQARPIQVSFSGDPKKVGKSCWSGKPWQPGSKNLPDRNNNYTTFASYLPDEKGKYRRQKKCFVALYAIILDDIGSKIPLNRIHLNPGWIIETSSGNFQLGYLLQIPITNPAEADQLINAIIKAGLTDPCTSGLSTRLGRLPVSVNGKPTRNHAKPWESKLWQWCPERRYTVAELLAGLKIAVSAGQYPVQSLKQSKKPLKNPGAAPGVPQINDNQVLPLLKLKGLYKHAKGSGKHVISCPWRENHTRQEESGTVYYEPTPDYPHGGFHCFHTHCCERSLKDLLTFLNPDLAEPGPLPVIYVQEGKMPQIVNQIEEVLSKTQRHFQRAGQIVTIIRDSIIQETRVQPLSVSNLSRELAELAVWRRFDRRTNSWLACDPPEKYLRYLHENLIYQHLPVLNGICHQPWLKPDGTLVNQSGYDHATGMYGAFNPLDFAIPEQPTRADAEKALDILNTTLMGDFPFASKHDRSAALSALLTAVIRPSLCLAPMYHCQSHTVSSGKTYLCALIAALATPEHSIPHTFSENEDECRKLIISSLRNLPLVLPFDNLTTDLLAHPFLCTMLTSEWVSGRLLGESKTLTFSTRVLMLSNGNNVEPSRDMRRRVIPINLDPPEEMPACRKFDRDPLKMVRTSRASFISQALIIIRAYVCSQEKITECPPLASYDEWSDLCRKPLLWLNLPDPATELFTTLDKDPDRGTLGLILTGWRRLFGNQPVLLREALKKIVDQDHDLLETIRELPGFNNGPVDNRLLGQWLKRNVGRTVDGLRFIRVEAQRGAVKWQVQSKRA